MRNATRYGTYAAALRPLFLSNKVNTAPAITPNTVPSTYISESGT
jgi:hypothetical protein